MFKRALHLKIKDNRSVEVACCVIKFFIAKNIYMNFFIEKTERERGEERSVLEIFHE